MARTVTQALFSLIRDKLATVSLPARTHDSAARAPRPCPRTSPEGFPFSLRPRRLLSPTVAAPAAVEFPVLPVHISGPCSSRSIRWLKARTSDGTISEAPRTPLQCGTDFQSAPSSSLVVASTTCESGCCPSSVGRPYLP